MTTRQELRQQLIDKLADSMDRQNAEAFVSEFEQAVTGNTDQLQGALSHVLEFIPTDSRCDGCVAAKQLAYECNSKIAKALDRHDSR